MLTLVGCWHHLQHFKKPDLRASHVRRLADLRSRGADAEAMVGVAYTSSLTLLRGDLTFARVSFVSKPGLQDTRVSDTDGNSERKDPNLNTSLHDDRRLVASTFSSYRPETDAEVSVLGLSAKQS